MNRSNTILLVLLLFQGALIGAHVLRSDGPAETEPRGLLLAGLSAEAVTRLTISEGGEDGAEDASVTLDKGDGAWVVVERWGYEADAAKVDELVRELAALEVADVVSTSALHHIDLGVGDDAPTKRVTLTAGGSERTVLFGTSGRGSSTHARTAGDERVVAVRDFSTWRVNARPDSWVQRTALEVDAEAVTRLELSGAASLVLEATDAGWLVDGAPAELDAVTALVKKAAKISLSKVHGEGGLAGAPLLTVTLATAEGSTRFQVGAGPDENSFLVAVDGRAHTVQVGKWAMEALLAATPADLTAEIPLEAPPE